MKRKLAVLVLFTLSWVRLGAESREFEGTIISKEGATIKIEFESNWAPVAGDPVEISALIAGRTIKGGTAEVISVEGNRITASVLSGKANVKMKAIIRSESPAAVNVDGDTLYTFALEKYSKAFKAGEGPFQRDQYPDRRSVHFQEAIPFLKQAAEKGNAKAMYLYGDYLDFAEGDLRDHKKAAELLIAAAEGDFLHAQLDLAKQYKIGSFSGEIPKDKAKARYWMKKAADAGLAEAADEFSQMLVFEGDYDESIQYQKIAAEGGYPQAQFYYGKWWTDNPQLYSEGKFSMETGMEWMRKAAGNGYYPAMVMLGDIYYNGGLFFPSHYDLIIEKGSRGEDTTKLKEQWNRLKIEKDVAKAIEWYGKAAETDSYAIGEGYERLGMIYLDRLSGFFDPAKAAKIFEEGGKHSGPCRLELAYLYARGIGVEKSPEKAYELIAQIYKNAPIYKDAIVAMGYCNLYGVGIPKNYSKAKELFEEAIENEYDRHGMALIHLGDMYRKGWGVAQDLRQAEGYYNQATWLRSPSKVGDKRGKYKSLGNSRNARRLLFDVSKKDRNAFGALWVCGDAVRQDPTNAVAYRYWGIGLMDRSLKSLAKKHGYHEAAIGHFKTAIELGDLTSNYYLGEAYYNGLGVKKDREAAKRYFQLALDAGVDAAQKYLDRL